jgi:hypothetical protein
MRIYRTEEEQVSEELLGKVYKKGRGLLRIPIYLCIQRYINIPVNNKTRS